MASMAGKGFLGRKHEGHDFSISGTGVLPPVAPLSLREVAKSGHLHDRAYLCLSSLGVLDAGAISVRRSSQFSNRAMEALRLIHCVMKKPCPEPSATRQYST